MREGLNVVVGDIERGLLQKKELYHEVGNRGLESKFHLSDGIVFAKLQPLDKRIFKFGLLWCLSCTDLLSNLNFSLSHAQKVKGCANSIKSTDLQATKVARPRLLEE